MWKLHGRTQVNDLFPGQTHTKWWPQLFWWIGPMVDAGYLSEQVIQRFFQTIYILCLCRACACNIPCGQSPRKYACGSQAVISTAQSGRLVMSVFSSWFSVFSSLHRMKLAILPTTTSHNAKSAGTAHNPINQRNLLHPKICNVACLRRGEVI